MLVWLLAVGTRGVRPLGGATSTDAPITSAAPTFEPRQLTNATYGYDCGDGYGYGYGYVTNTSEDSAPPDSSPCSLPPTSAPSPAPAPPGKVIATVSSALTLTGLTVEQARAIGPALVEGIAKSVGVPETQVEITGYETVARRLASSPQRTNTLRLPGSGRRLQAGVRVVFSVRRALPVILGRGEGLR